jgi:hypothetical protein
MAVPSQVHEISTILTLVHLQAWTREQNGWLITTVAIANFTQTARGEKPLVTESLGNPFDIWYVKR